MSKLIILDEGDIRRLTFEEILKLYKPLMRSMAYKFGNLRMEFEDLCQIVSIGLWRAYEYYDSSKTVGFSVLAKSLILNELREVYLYESKKKRSGSVVLSIDGKIEGRWNDISIMDILASDEDLEENTVLKDNLKEFMSKITKKQKEAIAMLSISSSYKEVAQKLGVGDTTISMRMTAAKKIFNECMAV